MRPLACDDDARGLPRTAISINERDPLRDDRYPARDLAAFARK